MEHGELFQERRVEAVLFVQENQRLIDIEWKRQKSEEGLKKLRWNLLGSIKAQIRLSIAFVSNVEKSGSLGCPHFTGVEVASLVE